MFDELYPEERDTSINQQLYRPAPQPESPGFTKGLGSALADVLPYARYSIDSAWQGIYDVGKKAAEVYDTASMAKPPTLRGDIIGEVGRSPAALDYRNQAKQYEPDPAAVGIAGQIVHGLGSTIAKAGIYSLAGPAAPALFGADLGVNRTQELMDKGVDAETAVNAGAVSGVAGAAMLKIPPSVGATRTQSAVVGAVINPALNVAEIGGIHQILQHANYEDIAAQYKPFDPLNLTIAALTGGLFGAAFHSSKPMLTPDEHAAALTMNEAITRNNDALTPAGDVHAANLATDAQIAARQQLDAGEPVSVADGLPVDGAKVSDAASAVADLLPIAGNRLTRGDRQKAEQQLADIQYKLDRHDLNANQEGYTKQDFIEQARAENPRLPARKVAKIAETMANEAKANDRQDMQSMVDRLQSQLSKDDLARSAFGELNKPTPIKELEPQIMPADPELMPLADGISNALDTKKTEPGLAGEVPEKSTGEVETPEAKQAARILARNPEALVRNEAGEDVPISELMSESAEHDEAAKTEMTMYQAAIECALSFGDNYGNA